MSSHDGRDCSSRSFRERRHTDRIMTFRSLFDRWSQILARGGGAFRTEASAAMCPRCGTASTGFLGQARSSVDWFACHGCSYVWSLANPLPINTEHVSSLSHTRVLIVDDDTTVLHALQLALAAYKPFAAQTVTEALTLLQHSRPELLITDYFMPNMTGAELIGHARARHPTLKVIMLTGYEAMLDLQQGGGPDRHLTKPCSVQRLREAVEDLIGRPIESGAAAFQIAPPAA